MVVCRTKQEVKIVLLENINETANEMFGELGYTNVVTYQKSLSEEELKEVLKDTTLLGIRSRTKITEELLQYAPNLLGIGCFCIGINQVDLDACKQRGIPVFNAPFSNTRSVAELTVAEIIMLMREIPQRNVQAHRGNWMKSVGNACEVRNKKLGIVGYGHIGSQVGVLAEGLGMEVYYYDIVEKLALGNAKPVSTLHNLLEKVDVVSLHVPENNKTKNMISALELAQMKRGSYLINNARGSIIVIPDLVRSMADGQIRGCAIDVFPVEPESKEERFISELQGADNAILTPHIGGSTVEAQRNIGKEVAQKLCKLMDTGSTCSAVNFVEMNMPHPKETTRILHIHNNVPGILAQITKIISENNINITGQYLQTDKEIGYVAIDIEMNDARKIMPLLRNIQGTIQTRIIC